MSVEELKHDRPREYAKLVKSGELRRKIVKPVANWKLRIVYGFGLTCLATGITLVVLIIYTLIKGVV